MNRKNIIKAPTEDQIFKHLTADLKKHPIPEDYSVWLHHGSTKILLHIDIDLGGGFESGISTTRFTAPVTHASGFSFTIRFEGILEKVEKFFGMQDIIIGYPVFDKKFLIRSNNETKIKTLFSDKSVRDTLISLNNFSFSLVQRHVPDRIRKKTFLELNIDDGITNPIRLK